MSDIINANFDIHNCTDDIICIFGIYYHCILYNSNICFLRKLYFIVAVHNYSLYLVLMDKFGWAIFLRKWVTISKQIYILSVPLLIKMKSLPYFRINVWMIKKMRFSGHLFGGILLYISLLYYFWGYWQRGEIEKKGEIPPKCDRMIQK